MNAGIEAFNEEQAASDREICALLAAEIEKKKRRQGG